VLSVEKPAVLCLTAEEIRGLLKKHGFIHYDDPNLYEPVVDFVREIEARYQGVGDEKNYA